MMMMMTTTRVGAGVTAHTAHLPTSSRIIIVPTEFYKHTTVSYDICGRSDLWG